MSPDFWDTLYISSAVQWCVLTREYGAWLSAASGRFVAFALEPASTPSYGHSGRKDGWRSRFSQSGEECFDFLFLPGLQGLNLHHVSGKTTQRQLTGPSNMLNYYKPVRMSSTFLGDDQLLSAMLRPLFPSHHRCRCCTGSVIYEGPKRRAHFGHPNCVMGWNLLLMSLKRNDKFNLNF